MSADVFRVSRALWGLYVGLLVGELGSFSYWVTRKLHATIDFMEHRWGERVGVDLPVRITGHPFSVRTGRLQNLSVSGAFIKVDYELRLLSRIQIAIEMPQRSKHEAPILAAYVARKYKDGIGVEWCEFAPSPIPQLLYSFSARPHSRLRKPEPAAAVAIARLSAPLLKHGS